MSSDKEEIAEVAVIFATECPSCGTMIRRPQKEVFEGTIITCTNCGTELEILSIDPPVLREFSDFFNEEYRSV